jgi:uroporphyrinogen III methyltransferase / synthase
MAVAVLTRDQADVSAYASALAPLGLTVVAMPVTKTVGPADPGALSRALDTGDYAAIMVTSARAADELAQAVGALAGIRATMPDLPDVWAVGAATRVALEKARLPAHQPEGVRDGVDLANALVVAKQLRGKRVLVPRAEDGRTEPLVILRGAGADVVDVIVYRTVALTPDDPALAAGADLLVRGGAAICGLFAPSQVTALAAAISAREHELAGLVTQFCAIGETTAAALRTVGVREVAVALAPTPDGMAQAVRSVYPSP